MRKISERKMQRKEEIFGPSIHAQELRKVRKFTVERGKRNMKIEKALNTMEFKEVPIGSVFKEAADDQYYIKVQEALVEDRSTTDYYEAVNLENGGFEMFLPEDEVVLCPHATLMP